MVEESATWAYNGQWMLSRFFEQSHLESSVAAWYAILLGSLSSWML